MFASVFRWLRGARSSQSVSRMETRAQKFQARLGLEYLDERLVPAQLTVTSAADPGLLLMPGTLRYEVALANADAYRGFSDKIGFDTRAMGTTDIVLRYGQIELSGSGATTIDGSDGGLPVTIDGNRAGRVFLIDSGATAILENLTVQHGQTKSGGGIYNNGMLTLNDDTIMLNLATYGGGIMNSGRLAVKLIQYHRELCVQRRWWYFQSASPVRSDRIVPTHLESSRRGQLAGFRRCDRKCRADGVGWLQGQQ